MILAVLDDLMFSSKIRTAAAHLNQPLVFARSEASALAELKKGGTTLVVLDLNNPRTNPMGIVTAMKADPALADVRTVAYASHVEADLMATARAAGVDAVLPRSAFSAGLADILAGAR